MKTFILLAAALCAFAALLPAGPVTDTTAQDLEEAFWIPATYHWQEFSTPSFEIKTPGFLGTIFVTDAKLAPSGNIIVPGLGECVDGQKVLIELHRRTPTSKK